MPDEISATPTIQCFLLKVASRCNLSCDYCYMYEHADQSWRNQPHMFSSEIPKDGILERLSPRRWRMAQRFTFSR